MKLELWKLLKGLLISYSSADQTTFTERFVMFQKENYEKNKFILEFISLVISSFYIFSV